MGSKYKGLKASTNSAFCASLREDGVCVLAEDVSCVFEIVINGVDREAIESAMRAGIHAACQVPGVLQITAANYEGSWGFTVSICIMCWNKWPASESLQRSPQSS